MAVTDLRGKAAAPRARTGGGGRPVLWLLVLTFAAIGGLYFGGVRIPISLDTAIQNDIAAHSSPGDMDKRISAALAQDDVDSADNYASISRYMGWPIAPDVQQKLNDAHTPAATALRNAKQFGGGFVTGEGTTNAGLAGALASDVTVVGDVRDIAGEGQKMISGQPYSQIVLGLSLVGLAATVATVATGGGGIVAKAGVSILKAAERAGTLTDDFARVLRHSLSGAMDFTEFERVAKRTNLTDLRATETAFSDYARTIKKSDIFPTLGKIGKIGEETSPAETVRLMRYVHSERDLDDVAEMSGKLGKKTRGVIEITGKTALRAFRTSLNIVEFLVAHIAAFAAWLGGIFGLGILRRGVRAIRGA